MSVFDHGLTVGDGVFETAKVVDGVPFALSRHLARLVDSARRAGLPRPTSTVRRAVDETLAANAEHHATPCGCASPSPAAPARSAPSGAPGPTLVVALAPSRPGLRRRRS